MADSILNTRNLSFATGLSVLCLVTGTLVSNFYLSRFGIVDYSIVQGRVILTGAVCLVTFVVFVFFWLAFLDNEKPDNNRLGAIILNGAVKPVIFADALWIFFPFESAAPTGYTLLGRHLAESAISAGMVFGVMGTILAAAQVRDHFSDEELRRHPLSWAVLAMAAIMILCGLSASAIVAASDSSFRGLLKFSCWVSFFLTMNQIGLWRKAKYVDTGELPAPATVFARDPRQGLRAMDKGFWGALYVFLFLSLLHTYAVDVYSYLPEAAGGNRPVEYTIVTTSGDTVTGLLIHRTPGQYYLEHDGTILKYNIDEIRKFVPPKPIERPSP